MKPFKKTYLYSIFIFVSLSCFLNSYSQKSVKTIIDGLVVDSKTGLPLSGTNVFLEKTTIGTITDKVGKYRIETSAPVDKIAFSYIGYKTEVRSISEGIAQFTVDIPTIPFFNKILLGVVSL